jgi:hypothetical protein
VNVARRADAGRQNVRKVAEQPLLDGVNKDRHTASDLLSDHLENPPLRGHERLITGKPSFWLEPCDTNDPTLSDALNSCASSV